MNLLGVIRQKRENMSVHDNTPTPKCPHCGHEMDTDEMCYGKPTCEVDLFALAPKEDRAVIECPACDQQYWVQGGYAPKYTSAFAEEDL